MSKELAQQIVRGLKTVKLKELPSHCRIEARDRRMVAFTTGRQFVLPARIAQTVEAASEWAENSRGWRILTVNADDDVAEAREAVKEAVAAHDVKKKGA